MIHGPLFCRVSSVVSFGEQIKRKNNPSGGDNVFIFTNKRKPHELIIGTKEQNQSSMVVIIGNFTKEDVSKFLNQ